MPISYLSIVNEITAPLPPMPVARLGPPPLVPLAVPLEEATVLIASSVGVHLRSDPPFASVDDLSCRRLAQDVDPSEVRPSHPSPIRRPGRQDVNVVHPYQRLAELAEQKVIGSPSPFHLSMLGAIKQLTRIVTELGPAVVSAAGDAGADLVLVVPLCPACHQAMGLLARVVERGGVPTVSVTGARDVTEMVRPPRAAYLNYPLGYSLGRPGDAAEQRVIVRDVLELAEADLQPGAIVDLDHAWPDPGWEGQVLDRYRKEADTVRSQREKEFGPDGRHLALEEVAAVEQMAADGLL